MMSILKTALASAAASAAGAAGAMATREWWRTWGVAAADVAKPLPGDELVPDAEAVDTRGITIAAKPDEVWPWLVQMGFRRAGWYSYDTIDMNHPSVERIVPEWQSLAVGDVVPTHPSGGFVVKAMEPGRSLVLYNDTPTLAAQQAAAAERGVEAMPSNLRASGAFLENAGPEFAASWAFVLEPVPEGTRLIERFRARMSGGPMPWLLKPIVGFGVFIMTRRQMLGIRTRAERLGAGIIERPAQAAVTPA
jgi:hypothetical protein